MKSMYLKISFVLLVLCFMEAGCEKEADWKINQLDQLDFKIVTMNKNNTETTDFEVGEAIVLAFKAINHSGEEIELKLKSSYLSCKEFQNEKDFLFVNKKSDNYNVDSSFIPMGKPLLNPINCLAINLPYYAQTFKNGETILESAFWNSNPDNNKLDAGKYFTTFSLTLADENMSKTWNLRCDFEVK